MHVLTPNLLPIESRSSVVKDNMSGFRLSDAVAADRPSSHQGPLLA